MENPPNIGDRVRFIDGSFRGMEGNVIAVNVGERHADIQVNVWGRAIRVPSPFNALELVPPQN